MQRIFLKKLKEKCFSNFDPPLRTLTTWCAGSHCVDPPLPEADHKLLLQWNSNYPPAHGETVMYVCNAGNKFNRFEGNFYKWNMTLECLVDNKFQGEPNVSWPTCANGKVVLVLALLIRSL